jgi:hypothetical protein
MHLKDSSKKWISEVTPNSTSLPFSIAICSDKISKTIYTAVYATHGQDFFLNFNNSEF